MKREEAQNNTLGDLELCLYLLLYITSILFRSHKHKDRT